MADISGAMGETKAGFIDATGAEYVTACDSSCLMHLEGVLRRKRMAAKTIHIASILAAQEQAGATRGTATLAGERSR
jgi:L-lactate dehydrogenase complex protein LldE